MAAPPPHKKSSGTGWMIAIVVVALLAIPCISVAAVVAIVAMLGYMQRSKTAEADRELSHLFESASAYYAMEDWSQRSVLEASAPGAAQTSCTVESARTTNVPGAGRTAIDWTVEPRSFDQLGFVIADPIYYQYEIVSVGPGCGHGPNTDLYTFRAFGDLDGDGHWSLFTMTARSNAANELVHSEITRQDELE